MLADLHCERSGSDRRPFAFPDAASFAHRRVIVGVATPTAAQPYHADRMPPVNNIAAAIYHGRVGDFREPALASHHGDK